MSVKEMKFDHSWRSIKSQLYQWGDFLLLFLNVFKFVVLFSKFTNKSYSFFELHTVQFYFYSWQEIWLIVNLSFIYVDTSHCHAVLLIQQAKIPLKIISQYKWIMIFLEILNRAVEESLLYRFENAKNG